MTEKRIRLTISGSEGKMGQMIKALAQQDDAFDSPIRGVDATTSMLGTTFSIAELGNALFETDVLMIFHNQPDAVCSQVGDAVRLHIPVIIGTTGLTKEQLVELNAMALQAKTPIVQANNFSVGIAVVEALTMIAAAKLPLEFQPEIVERHHCHKLDSPSGTALMLRDAICGGRGWVAATTALHGRSGRSEKGRPDVEIGIHTIRAGGIIGDHTVLFAGPHERLELIHQAQSREAFAAGALYAAKWAIKNRDNVFSLVSFQEVLGLYPEEMIRLQPGRLDLTQVEDLVPTSPVTQPETVTLGSFGKMPETMTLDSGVIAEGEIDRS